MSSSWKIGSAYGIPVYLHWTMLLVPLWLGLTQSGVMLSFALALTAAMFGCVVLHELGHALAARHFRIGTRDITLYPIGGVARLESVGNKPSEEFWIAVAGPAVNLVIALALGIVWFIAFLLDPPLAYVHPVGQFIVWLGVLNIGMVIFNLLPAFPMDGGRVLRSLLAMGLGQLRATRIAVNIATVVALGVALLAVFYLHNPWMILIAAFIFLAGQQELEALEVRARLEAERPQPFHGADIFWWPPRSAPEPSAHTDAWSDFAYRPKVTVHVWDAEKQVWVKQ